MELSLAVLIERQILTPVDGDNAPDCREEIHAIVVYEDDDVFFDCLPDGALVFFPRGVGRLPLARLRKLRAALCKAVIYGDEPALHFRDGETAVPLYYIAEGLTLSEAVERCYAAVYSGMKQLVEVSLDTMEKLTDNLLNHQYEDANMIKVIHNLMGCPVAFTTSDFHLQKVTVSTEYLVVNPLYTEDSFDWDTALSTFHLGNATFHPGFARGISGVEIGGYLYQNAYCRERGCRISIFPITDSANCYGYIFLALDEGTKALSPEMNMKLQQVLVALKFEIIKSDEIAHTINRYYDFLLDELIESDQTDFRKLMQKYGLVQKVIADEYRILVVGRKARSMKDVLFHELLTSQQFNLLYDRVVEVLGTINFFIFERKDSIVTLLPKRIFSDEAEGVAMLAKVFEEFLAERYEGCGVSDLVPTENVRQGYFQARKALAVSQRSADKAPFFYNDLGVLRFFFDRGDQVDITPLLIVYRKYILPIINYDKARGGELFPTLTTYINCCSSPSAACAALYIHKNTLYSRLNKISQLLDISLSDSEAVFNISLGIRIHTLVEAGIFQDPLGPEGEPKL